MPQLSPYPDAQLLRTRKNQTQVNLERLDWQDSAVRSEEVVRARLVQVYRVPTADNVPRGLASLVRSLRRRHDERLRAPRGRGDLPEDGGNGCQDELVLLMVCIDFYHAHDKELEDADARRDSMRYMTWFALFGTLNYPLAILITAMLGYDKAADIIGDIAPTYFVANSALVAAFFGANAIMDRKK